MLLMGLAESKIPQVREDYPASDRWCGQ